MHADPNPLVAPPSMINDGPNVAQQPQQEVVVGVDMTPPRDENDSAAPPIKSNPRPPTHENNNSITTAARRDGGSQRRSGGARQDGNAGILHGMADDIRFYYDEQGQLYYYQMTQGRSRRPPPFAPNVTMTESHPPPQFASGAFAVDTVHHAEGTAPQATRNGAAFSPSSVREESKAITVRPPLPGGGSSTNQLDSHPQNSGAQPGLNANGTTSPGAPMGPAWGGPVGGGQPPNGGNRGGGTFVPPALRKKYTCPVPIPPGKTKRAMGNYRNCCNCCLFTVDSWHSIIFAVLVFGLSVIYMVSVVPRGEWYSYLITSVLAVAAVGCLFLAVSIDPGIVPPAPLDETPVHSVKVVMVNNNQYPIQCTVCPTCHIYRPPRSTHCQFTDVCVEEFDHYCPVVGSCVAKRTFRFFTGFFIFTTMLIIQALIRTAVVMSTLNYSDLIDSNSGRWTIAACVITLVAGALFGLWVGIMGGQYLWFACINSTQKEMLRAQREHRELTNTPYHEGYCCNFFKRLFGPLGKSRIDSDYFV